MKKEYIDFTPHKIEVKYYKDLMKNTGSALASTVKFITQDIISRKPKLRSDSDFKLVKSLNIWAKKRGKYKVKVIWIKGSCKAFEKAVYQAKDNNNLPSPFGSFKHFKKIMGKYGMEKYRARLENGIYKIPDERENFFNLRVRGKISPEEINFI